jgi:hypothetical protein
VRPAFVILVAVLALAGPSAAGQWAPPAKWLAQARCIHVKEGPWTANTGNGYFGGMQFAPQTWKRVGGKPNPAFKHPGDIAYPFAVPVREQLYRAWLVWKRDGGTWRSWGAVGASCS